MNTYQNYKPFITGGIITIGMAIILNGLGVLFTDTAYIYSNIFIFIICWLLISFLISKVSVYKVIGLVVLSNATMIADNYMGIPDNPITSPLVILFWLGIAYLILPQFFKKYKIAILSVYGVVLSYFFVSRLMPNYLEDYHKNFVNFMLIPIPVFAALWGYEQWRWLKTLQADKGKAELALLKSQVNPHFFFNTLNNLYGLVIEKSDQAPEVVLKLSDMMRYTIYEGKKELVNLTDEVEYLETYIDLYKIRFQKRVDIKFTHEVDKEIQIAPLLFIILLENAFKHGAEKLIENAYIYLDLKMRDNQLFFTIENNYDSNAANRPAGIGLDNLKQRLTHLYPNQHELRIEKTDSTYTTHLNLLLNR